MTDHAAAALGGRSRAESSRAIPALIGASLAAWIVLWWWAFTAGGHAHHAPEVAALPRPAALGLAWMTMVAAMMFPLAAGLVGAIAERVPAAPGRRLAAGLAVAGFAAPWAAGGLALWAGAQGLAVLSGPLSEVPGGPGVVAGVIVCGAGAFQLTVAKRSSLSVCRTPDRLVARRWRADGPTSVMAFRVGAAYGLASITCCWALMALAVMAAGVGMLVMMFFAAVMLIEGLTPWGPAFARAIGSALAALGVALILLALVG